jgi:short-subunit dehydrogenase
MSKESISSVKGDPGATVLAMNSVAGKWALITGASSGLGLEFADLLAALKVNLVLAARRQEPMEKLASVLRRKYGVDVLVEAIDLASPGAANRPKAYVLALGEALHDELSPHGVFVTTLSPGHTETGFDAEAGLTPSPFLRLLTMKPRPVATSGIRALLRAKAMVVPGLANKMATFSNRLTPRSMQRATMRKIMGS